VPLITGLKPGVNERTNYSGFEKGRRNVNASAASDRRQTLPPEHRRDRSQTKPLSVPARDHVGRISFIVDFNEIGNLKKVSREGFGKNQRSLAEARPARIAPAIEKQFSHHH